MSKVYHFKLVQTMPVSLEEAWDFFSDPGNLQALTPASVSFRILSEFQSKEMYPGQVIEYQVKPLLGIPVYWMTEITHVMEGRFFIDEQRFGPYSFWHHQHHFREVPGGVEMTDIVHYKIPFWLLGDIANSLLVRRKLKEIFDFRFRKVVELFGEAKPGIA